MTPEHHPDRDLLARAKADPAAAAQIYDAYADAVFGFLVKRCGHRQTAEDLLSQTFLKLLEALPRLEWRGYPLSAWLYRTASNALIDHWRKSGRELPADEGLEEGIRSPQDTSHEAELALERDKLLPLISSLSARDQQVLDLRFFAGLEPQEIADMLGTSANHASVMGYRALGRLRQAYLKTYGTTSSQ